MAAKENGDDDGAANPVRDPDVAAKCQKYVVVKVKENHEHGGPIKYLWDLVHGGGRWKKCLHASQHMDSESHESWRQKLSIFILKLLVFINDPLKWLGIVVEFSINFFIANGGILVTMLKLLFPKCWKNLVIPRRDGEDFMSIIAAMDPRLPLLPSEAAMFPEGDYGVRSTLDVMVMAAKLAYENAAYVKRVVERIWKMNFVGFYNCWDGYQKVNSTQVFVFTDKPTDAKAIVISFRGTEGFSAVDWATDFDFSWFEVKGLGAVHTGFLEALGLCDRGRVETFATLEENRWNIDGTSSGLSNEEQETKLLAYDEMAKLTKKLMAENPDAKLFVTGHSLGGALALLFVSLLYYNKEDSITSRLGSLYTFGQPRVGGDAFAHFMLSNFGDRKYWRIVYSSDMVTRVPFDDKLFQFKHFGLCHYFDASFDVKVLTDQEVPYRNFVSMEFLTNHYSMRVTAMYELIDSVFRGVFYGCEYRESLTNIFFRIVALLFPGIVSHSLTNYVNAIRLGNFRSSLVHKLTLRGHHPPLGVDDWCKGQKKEF